MHGKEKEMLEAEAKDKISRREATLEKAKAVKAQLKL
jgi:hypothetical protein